MKKITSVRLTLFIALLLIALTMFVKSSQELEGDIVSEKDFWLYKTYAPSIFNVVILGDSRANHALSPKHMKEVLGDSFNILNFAYDRGGLNKTMFEAAENKLDFSKENKAILLCVSPRTLSIQGHNKQYHQEIENGKDLSVKLRLKYRSFSALFDPIHQGNPLQPKETTLTYGHKKYMIFHNDGWIESWLDKPFESIDQSDVYNAYKNNLNVLKIAQEEKDIPRDYVDKIYQTQRIRQGTITNFLDQINQWSKKGIKVIAFRPPVDQELREIENRLFHFADNFFKEKISQNGGIWLDIPQGKYVCGDKSHLNRDEAIKFSRDIAQLMKDSF